MDDFDRLLDELIQVGHSPRGRYSAEKSWRLLERRMNPQEAYMRRFIVWTMRAAAILLLVIVSWSVYEYVLPSPLQSISADGEVCRYVLPDNSIVVLNRHSSLTYPKRFSRRDRKVTLAGGGYFEVHKETGRPFYVDAGPVTVKVLGTHFNVDAFPEEDKINTTLLEGSVEVTSATESIRLRPGETAVYSRTKQCLESYRNQNAEASVSWREGTFLFDNLPLSEIALQLSRAFQVEIKIADETLVNYRIRARFVKGENLDEMLALMQKAGHFQYEWKKDGTKNIIWITREKR